VRGSVDTHVHVAPDVVERRIGDVALARRCAELGLAGFQLKSHYCSTAERARSVEALADGVRVLGAITLNRAVGGLNALAVEVAAREGARTVWFPTVSSVNEAHEMHPAPPGARVPVWVAFELELRDAGLDPEPVAVLDGEGRLLGAAREVLAVIARHDMVLATGHLARDEIYALVAGAVEAGVRRIVVTHPEFPSQRLSIPDQIELAEQGALLERCFTTPHTGKVSWELVCRASREVTPAHTVWSSDLGQRFNPPVEDGLAMMADQFLAAGFTDEEVVTMAVTNTRRLAGLEAS
jgi:hypothetical protein